MYALCFVIHPMEIFWSWILDYVVLGITSFWRKKKSLQTIYQNILHGSFLILTTSPLLTLNFPLSYRFVPNDMIGCIIGKGGSKIAEIRQISGAMIRISKSDDNSERESAERQITITGNADSVALAKSLINMSLDLHKSKMEEGGNR